MKSRKRGLAGVAVVLVCCCLLSFVTKGRSLTEQRFGPEVNGLRLMALLDKSHHDDLPDVVLTLQNVGDKDVVVNLGSIVGAFQSPHAFHLSVKDDAGTVHELHYVDSRYAGIAGRVDNYVVPLRADSSYSIRISLKQFWNSSAKEQPFQFKPGKYQISAILVGDKLQHHNSEDREKMVFAKMLWQGKLQSNAFNFVRR